MYTNISVSSKGVASAYKAAKPLSPYNELEKIYKAAAVNFDKQRVAKELSNTAILDIGFFRNFFEELGKTLFSCFGFKTTYDKINDIHNAILNKKYADIKEEESPKEEEKSGTKEDSPRPLNSPDENKSNEEARLREEAKKVEEVRLREEAKKAEEAAARVEKEANERSLMSKEDGKAQEIFSKQDIDQKNLEYAISKVLTDEVLFDIGYEEAKIKKAIYEINDFFLKTLDSNKLKACYKHLASINHYEIAAYYAEKAGIKMPEDTGMSKSAKNLDDAEKIIKEIRYIDHKKNLSHQLEERRRAIAQQKKVLNKLSTVLTDQNLADIGNHDAKIKTNVEAIEKELQPLDNDGKIECYRYLATINHYSIARHFAVLAEVQIENIQDYMRSVRDLIKGKKFLEAREAIKSSRYVDVRAQLTSELNFKEFEIKSNFKPFNPL